VFSGGDDAKLLLAMLPPDRAELFVFGREGDWERLAAECAIDPGHTLTLWPAEDALTVGGYLDRLPEDSGWRRQAAAVDALRAAGEGSLAPTGEGRSNGAEAAGAAEAVGAATATVTSALPPPPGELPLLRVIVLDGVYNHARNMFRALSKVSCVLRAAACCVLLVACCVLRILCTAC
jgi:hypothetical protein